MLSGCSMQWQILDQENLLDTILKDYKDGNQSNIAIEASLSKMLVNQSV
jgi:ribosomal protein L21E